MIPVPRLPELLVLPVLTCPDCLDEAALWGRETPLEVGRPGRWCRCACGGLWCEVGDAPDQDTTADQLYADAARRAQLVWRRVRRRDLTPHDRVVLLAELSCLLEDMVAVERWRDRGRVEEILAMWGQT